MREQLKLPVMGSGLEKTRKWTDKKNRNRNKSRGGEKESVGKFKEREAAFRGWGVVFKVLEK